MRTSNKLSSRAIIYSTGTASQEYFFQSTVLHLGTCKLNHEKYLPSTWVALNRKNFERSEIIPSVRRQTAGNKGQRKSRCKKAIGRDGKTTTLAPILESIEELQGN
jgi:hypothetical protein